MKKILLPAFIILALVQWYVPGKMLWNREEVLRKGQSYRFETEPVDPSHPFKGRYIALDFKEDAFNIPVVKGFEYGQEVYVLLTTDKNGFAKISSLSEAKPAGKTGFLKATVSYNTVKGNAETVHLNYPFEEFYMDEFKAPKAEIVYRNSTSDSTKKTYAVVKVWKGEAVIENVFINNTPIKDLIR